MTPRRMDTWYFIAWAVSLFTMALVLSSPVAAESRGLHRLYVVLTRAVSRLAIVHAEPLPAPIA